MRTPVGDVDARVETKLERAREVVDGSALDALSADLEAMEARWTRSTPRHVARPDALREADLHRRTGRVVDLIGLIVEASGLEAEVGEVCTIDDRPRPPDRARGGRRLPRRPHAADGARRRDGHRPGRAA